MLVWFKNLAQDLQVVSYKRQLTRDELLKELRLDTRVCVCAG
jgi:hypothetical protein